MPFYDHFLRLTIRLVFLSLLSFTPVFDFVIAAVAFVVVLVGPAGEDMITMSTSSFFLCSFDSVYCF
jgi:hypothetical protein